MTHYKNISRTARLRYALKYWWNMVRNFDDQVEDASFFSLISWNLKRDEVAAVIRDCFSEKELEPYTEEKGGRLALDRDSACIMLYIIWKEEPLRKGCRTALKIMRDRILRKLRPVEDDARFERRFRDLCNFMALESVEADLLMLMYLRARRLFGNFPEIEDILDRPRFYAMAVDRSCQEVLTALSGNGRLRRYNCMGEDYLFNWKELGGYFEGVDEAPPDERYYRLSGGEHLPWDFFGELAAEDGAILKEMLRASWNGGRLNILFYGVPGSGKTSFAHTLAAEVGLAAYELLQGEANGANISAKTRMAGIQIFNAKVEPAGKVLVIDEADELLRTSGIISGGRSRGGSEKGAVNAILDGMKVPAIWISNAPAQEMDESVRRRFDYSVRFRSLTSVQREKIWKNSIMKLDMGEVISESSAASFAERYEASPGGIAMVLENVKRLNPDPKNAAELIERIMRPHCELMHSVIQDGLDRPASDYSLEGLNIRGGIGLDKIVEAVRNFRRECETGRPSAQVDRPRMNLLLWGPPGSGKTEYVKYLGNVLKAKVVVKMGSDLLDKYVGGTEERIASAFAEAEAEKAILFLDEIDGLLQNRSKAVRSWEVTQVNELLHQMENFSGVMIGATNFFDNLDPAVLRRFTFKLEFGYLDDDGKRLFFERMFNSKLSDIEAKRLDAVARLTPGDFRTVRQSLYYLGASVDNAMRIGELEKEARIKGTTGCDRIGF